jgi:hypothetical protein
VAGISTIIWIAWLLVASGAAHLAYGWHARGHGRLFLEVLIYGPPEHADASIHATKADAMASKQHFAGQMTE